MFSSNVETAGFSAVGQDELEQVNGGCEPVAVALGVVGTVAAVVGATIALCAITGAIVHRVSSGSK